MRGRLLTIIWRGSDAQSHDFPNRVGRCGWTRRWCRCFCSVDASSRQNPQHLLCRSWVLPSESSLCGVRRRTFSMGRLDGLLVFSRRNNDFDKLSRHDVGHPGLCLGRFEYFNPSLFVPHRCLGRRMGDVLLCFRKHGHGGRLGQSLTKRDHR